MDKVYDMANLLEGSSDIFDDIKIRLVVWGGEGTTPHFHYMKGGTDLAFDIDGVFLPEHSKPAKAEDRNDITKKVRKWLKCDNNRRRAFVVFVSNNPQIASIMERLQLTYGISLTCEEFAKATIPAKKRDSMEQRLHIARSRDLRVHQKRRSLVKVLNHGYRPDIFPLGHLEDDFQDFTDYEVQELISDANDQIYTMDERSDDSTPRFWVRILDCNLCFDMDCYFYTYRGEELPDDFIIDLERYLKDICMKRRGMIFESTLKEEIFHTFYLQNRLFWLEAGKMIPRIFGDDYTGNLYETFRKHSKWN